MEAKATKAVGSVSRVKNGILKSRLEEPAEDLQQRQRQNPLQLLSDEGAKILNLWSVHVSACPLMNAVGTYRTLRTFNTCLKMSQLHREMLLSRFDVNCFVNSSTRFQMCYQLVFQLHDICMFLCAHAMLGSSHARLGTAEVAFVGVGADWGGTEGIGAELRTIKRELSHLPSPSDPEQVSFDGKAMLS